MGHGKPHHSKRIMLFDPREPQSISIVGKEADKKIIFAMVYWHRMETSIRQTLVEIS